MAVEGRQKADERIAADTLERRVQANAAILRLSNGITLAVPRSLQAISTYVFLEQETWFEKELAFLPHVLRPGMTAIDIGANIGVYSLAMAGLVAPGRVFAYEPASDPRALLEFSRDLNQMSNLEVCGTALSDGRREGHLAFGASSEMNALADSGPGEQVPITSLDLEEVERRWPAPDFVKIDAEGEEERILAGGARFFAHHSPLVMFEIRIKEVINEKLMSSFQTLGYRLYRVVPSAPVLIPIHPDHTPIDPYEINVFAAKPDRARALAQAGLLVEDLPEWRPDAKSYSDFQLLWQEQAFAPVFAPLLPDLTALQPDYRHALAAYAVWRTAERPLPVRCAALLQAFHLLSALCQRAANFARWSTFARVAWEVGERVACVNALAALINDLERGPIEISEPFWPACPDFDSVAVDGNAAGWFLTSAIEQYERARTFSSYFRGASPLLDWLCQQPLASIEMQRRQVLIAARAGRHVVMPPRLYTASPDHLNAEIWRTGRIPGISLGA